MKSLFSIRVFLFGLQALVGGPVLIALGLSQAMFGWISEAIYARILYGLVGTGLGSLLFVVGALAIYAHFVPQEEDHLDDEPFESIDLTEAAANLARKYLSDSQTPLRIGIKQTAEGDYKYKIAISKNGKQPGDAVFRRYGITLLVKESLLAKLDGLIIDIKKTSDGKRGFHFDNPQMSDNPPSPARVRVENQKRTGRRMIFGVAGALGLMWLVVSGIVGWAGMNWEGKATFKEQYVSDARREMFEGRPREKAAPAESTGPESKNVADNANESMEADRVAAERKEVKRIEAERKTVERNAAAEKREAELAEKFAKERAARKEKQEAERQARLAQRKAKAEQLKREEDVKKRLAAAAKKSLRSRYQLKAELPGNGRTIQHLCASGANLETTFGRFLFASTDENGLIVYDLNSMTQVHKTPRGTGSVLAVSPNGQTLATSVRGQVFLWDVTETGKLIKRKTHEVLKKYIYCLAFSLDGRFLAAGGDEWQVILDVEDPKEVYRDQVDKSVKGCRFLNDGNSFMFTNGRSLKTVSLEKMETSQTVEKLGDGIYGQSSTIFHGGERVVVQVGPYLNVHNSQTGELIEKLTAGRCTTISITNGDTNLVTEGSDSLIVLDLKTLTKFAEIEGRKLKFPVFTGAGNDIAVVDDRKTIAIYELPQ